MLDDLKEKVAKANKDLVKYGLVVETWGNVSAFDEKTGYVLIKPSGVPYEDLTKDDIVIVDLNNNLIEGNLNPSSDTATHIEIYKRFKGIKSVIHTHSKWATIFSQARKEINVYGTTHADYFNQAIPVTRELTKEEIDKDYELNTGKIIVEKFELDKIDPLNCKAILVFDHGPFVWGSSIEQALHNAIVLEYVAEMAYYTESLARDKQKISDSLLNKHFNRKHGKNSYYGQKNKK